MKKINILKETSDFNRIIKEQKPYIYKDYIIYIEKKNQEHYKFGFSVGKKIGNAVTRNRIKRQLKAIADKKDYQNNFNCIIIVRRGILKQPFKEMKLDFDYITKKLKLAEEEINE